MVTVRILFLLLFLSPHFFAQQKEISQKKEELSEIKTEIQNLQNDINELSQKEKKSYTVVGKLNKQNFLLNKLITSYRMEIDAKDVQIETLQQEISSLTLKTAQLKANYARYASAIYKGIYRNDFIYLFDAGSLQQALTRYKYLKQFSASRKRDLQEIKEYSGLLTTKSKILTKEKGEKEQLLDLKSSEEVVLTKRLSEEKNLLKKFKNDKSAAQKSLADKKQAEKAIRNMIDKLIAQEELRKKELARKLAEKKRREALQADKTTVNAPNKEETITDFTSLESETAHFKSFSAMKGRLHWPVARGVVIRKFGEETNEKLHTVTLNYGIDIKIAGNLEVKSVGEGIVSAIEWLPGYGSVMIVTHKDGFRTVYGHLGQITVQEGSKVVDGAVLGSVSESIEGNVLHFEIWKERDHQNPEVWLAKK